VKEAKDSAVTREACYVLHCSLVLLYRFRERVTDSRYQKPTKEWLACCIQSAGGRSYKCRSW